MSKLEKNLAGVRKWCPATAAQIDATAVPEGFMETVGTDGTRTFAREVGGKIQWLGGTSMPRASAKALVTTLDAGVAAGTNGLGVSIGSGFEWAAFAGRLGSAQAVFVYEMDAGLLKMALSICDLAALLEEGKIILLTGDAGAAGEELAGVLAKHVGFEPPSVLHPLPTLVGERRNVHLMNGEAIVRRVVTERQSLIGSLMSQWKDGEKSDVVIGYTKLEKYAGERPLYRYMEEQGICGLCVDRHDAASLAGRVQFLLEHRPGRVVSDLFRAQLGCVPPSVGVETWVPPLAGASYWEVLPAGSVMMGEDRVVVQAGAHQGLLEELGFAKERIVFRAVELRGKVKAWKQEERKRVGIIADLPATDAAALGVTLPTHLAVLAAAREIVTAEYLSVHGGSARDVLRRALARAGVLSDAGLGDLMLRLIRNNLIASVPLLTLVGELQREGVPLRLIGNWGEISNMDGEGTVVQGFDSAAWEDVGVLVHLSPWGVVSPLVGEAIGAGVAIVGAQHATDGLAGSLAQLLKPDVDYARALKQNFVGTVKQLLREPGRRAGFCESAVKRLAQS